MPTGRPDFVTECRDRRWVILGADSPCTFATYQACEDAGFTPEIAGCVADNTAAIALVAAGAGVALMPELMVDHAPTGLAVVPVDTGVRRTIMAVVRESGPTASTDLVIDALKAAR